MADMSKQNNDIIAVIDMGSNSIRLQVSKIIESTYKVIQEHKATVRIGDNVYKDGEFSEADIETLLQVMLNIKSIIDNVGSASPIPIRAVATASFREAKNGEIVAKLITEKTGIDIEIIDGIEEARLLYLASSYYFPLTDGASLIVDMGGGSTEFSFVEDNKLIFSKSTSLGCSKLTHHFLQGDLPSKDQLKDLKEYISSELTYVLPERNINRIICSGGTLNNISFIHNKRNNLSDSPIKFTNSIFLKQFFNEITSKTLAERLKISGMEGARADIIVSAAMLANMLVKKYETDGIYTLSGGLRAGLTIDMMNKLGINLIFQEGAITDVRYARLLETGKKYYIDERHAMQVCSLSKMLFDDLKEALSLSDNTWQLLEASAILHDVGQYIAYSSHHKHSYYLLKNTEMSGFSDEEIEIIAQTARYHRKSMPKESHDAFSNLHADSKETVLKLSALIRIADALDRTHSGNVKNIALEKITNKSILLSVAREGDITMEIEGFNRKRDLLEKVTGKKVEIIL